MSKEIIRKKVRALNFSLLSPQVIKKIAAAKIVTPELYDVDGYPVDGGLMDLRLGAIDPGVRCRTCGGGLKECLGHPGRIELARAVIHIKYIKLINIFLKSFCSECGRILLSEDEIEASKKQKKKIKWRLNKSKDRKKCPYCGSAQKKIIFEKPSNYYERADGKRKRIFPNEIRERFSKISDEDIKLLGVNPKTCRPEWAILTNVIVPPVTVRPSITLETGERSEDDLTHKLSDIVRANQRLWENLNAGAPEVIIEDLWDLLQYHVTTLFDNTIANVPPARHRSGQPLKTITERIKGKEGRIRHNLTGKRVNYSSRAVISPDPYLEIDEVGVPYEVAKIITVPEAVTSLNLEEMKKMVMAEEYPAANYIIRPDGKRKKITPDLKEEIIEELEPGYIVERHLKDGDIVLFNRHPSLHRPSLMAHYVKVLPYKTFRMHPAVTAPYNADFDGDECNIHSPQTEEAKAEAKILLAVKKNLISVRNNTNLIGCKVDAIIGNYLLGMEKIEKNEAEQLLFNSGVNLKLNKKILDGKEVFSEILPEINFSAKSKSCLGEDCKYYNNCKKENCPYNAYLSIKNGKFISGRIDKTTFGVEDGQLIKLIDKSNGREVSFTTLKKAFSLGTNYLSRKGFTISIGDLSVDEEIIEQKNRIIQKAEEKAKEIIESYNNKSLESIPGKTKEETREIKILQVLNEVRSKIGEVIKSHFSKNNPVSIMINSGAGGNILYVTQIACCVGQQSLWAKRIEIGYTNRTLSFFKEKDLSPLARGFIHSSYLEGLKPHELFFGAITGRDGLMDTALRTPKSGYLYRRLANALQDLKVEYDGTVRDASENIVQFKYGGDGKDVSELHTGKEITPGEGIGIVTAQSFGEPSTQMALNVFHFAGVQEMQITLGLPRLIEILDARKIPKTPLMEIYLNKEYNNDKKAKEIAERIKETRLGEVASSIKVNFSDKKIEIELDPAAVRRIHISAGTITNLLKENFKAKLAGNIIQISEKDVDFKTLYRQKEKLKDMIISGVKGIKEVVVKKRKQDFVILTAGSNLSEIMKMKEVDKDKTLSNDIHEVAKVIGIEAARQLIIKEIENVIESQGLDIDKRHLSFIADAMTTSGFVKGITRVGIISEKSSVLARASFETPIVQFVNASIKGRKDNLSSVIENIILNQPVPIGTGLPGLLVEVKGPLTKEKKVEKKIEVKKGK